MDSAKLINRLNNLEAAARLILDESDKIKKQIDGENPKKPKKNGWTKEQEEKFTKRRMKTFLHHENA